MNAHAVVNQVYNSGPLVEQRANGVTIMNFGTYRNRYCPTSKNLYTEIFYSGQWYTITGLTIDTTPYETHAANGDFPVADVQ